MPQDNTKDNLKAERVVVVGDQNGLVKCSLWHATQVTATFMLKAASNGPLPQPHSLPSSCLLYCLGAYQGYILHLSDLFLMLWLVSNLVESLF
jgi:hypothetical protein